MTQGFRVLPSYYEAIRPLPDRERLILWDAIMDLAFNGEEPAEMEPMIRGYYLLLKPTIIGSVQYYQKQKSNGDKGGRPPKNKPANNPIETHQKPKGNLDIDSDSDSDSETEGVRADKPPRSRFVPPSVEEVEVYCRERGNSVDPQRFVDYYSANGWMVGKNKMKDWKAAVRTWERGDSNRISGSNTRSSGRDANALFGLIPDVCE